MHSAILRAVKNVVAVAAERRVSRQVMNRGFAALPPPLQARFHEAFGHALFGRDHARVTPGAWLVDFAGRRIRVPIEGEDAALLFDFGLALTGHDVAVKELYRRLLTGSKPPRVFYDVGMNFGTHSLPFLVHGVRTVAFEPNRVCHRMHRVLCEANGVEPDVQATALGDREGAVTLSYPPGETWLGTTLADVEARLATRYAMESVTVPLRTIDSYVGGGWPAPDLLKIDTEGSELAVLRGAAGTLAEYSPLVVFECWRDGARQLVADFLAERGYALGLPATGAPLSVPEFLAYPAINFLARPDTAVEV